MWHVRSDIKPSYGTLPIFTNTLKKYPSLLTIENNDASANRTAVIPIMFLTKLRTSDDLKKMIEVQGNTIQLQFVIINNFD